MAESVASHHRVDSVSPVHVEQAYENLSRAGLNRRGMLERPESFTGLGALLIGLAFSCPDAVAVLFKDWSNRDGIATGLLIAFFFVGVFLWIHGAYLGRMPTAPREKATVRVIVWRAAYLVAIIVAIAIASNSIYHRIFGDCPGDSCGVGEVEDEIAPAVPPPDGQDSIFE